MIVDLLRVTTSDGVRLDGALRVPSEPADAKALPVDAFLFLHGTGSNFYSSTLFDVLAARLLELGSAVLIVNTRGHDHVSTAYALSGAKRHGAAYETVEDCRQDIAAWIGFLTTRGYARVGLLGHSLGALKAIYQSALVPQAAVQRLVALSPPRLSCSYYLASEKAEEFERTLTLAERQVAEGRGDALLEVTFPIAYQVTAAGYVEKYGREERYNLLKYVDRLHCPTLFTFGSQELQSSVAFSDLPEEIESRTAARTNCQIAVIAGGDHLYSGCRAELLARIESWLVKSERA